MVRTQIQLTEEQQEKLKRLAAERGVSIARLIREGVDVILARVESGERWEKLRGAIGGFRDREGARDVAERHDEYLKEIRSDERDDLR